MKKINSVWSFVEQFYPDYHLSKKVLHNKDLKRIITGDVGSEDPEYSKLQEKYGDCPEQAILDYNDSCKEIYEKSIQGFVKHLEKRVIVDFDITSVLIQAGEDNIPLAAEEAPRVLKLIEQEFTPNNPKKDTFWTIISSAIRNYVANKELDA